MSILSRRFVVLGHSLLGLLALAVWLPVNSSAREWTDQSGQLRRHAELVERVGDQVYFRAADGRALSCEFSRLSEIDQQHILDQEARVAVDSDHLLTAGVQARTLTYRPQPTESTALATPATHAAAPPLVKLTGFSGCTPWYCYRPAPHCPIPHCPPGTDTGKRIYSGPKSTWHLVDSTVGQISGTGAYWLTDKNGCCYHYLALLRCWHNSRSWLGFEGIKSPGGVTYWLLESGAINKSCYHVYYWSGTRWQHYDRCYREIPQ